jgi:hypothetical protein
MSKDPFLKTYYTSMSGNLQCAIDLLCDLEYKVRLDGDGTVTEMVQEQACIFFEHLIKHRSSLLIKDADGMRVTDMDDIKSSPFQQIESYGIYRYMCQLSKKVESRLLDVTMNGVTYFFADTLDNEPDSSTPPDGSTPETVVYLSDLTLKSSDLLIYYGTQPGIDNDDRGTPPTGTGSYIVLDKDQIYAAISELKSHYQSIIKYIESLGYCDSKATAVAPSPSQGQCCRPDLTDRYFLDELASDLSPIWSANGGQESQAVTVLSLDGLPNGIYMIYAQVVFQYTNSAKDNGTPPTGNAEVADGDDFSVRIRLRLCVNSSEESETATTILPRTSQTFDGSTHNYSLSTSRIVTVGNETGGNLVEAIAIANSFDFDNDGAGPNPAIYHYTRVSAIAGSTSPTLKYTYMYAYKLG